MGFLEGLFEDTVPEMPIADEIITADAVVAPGSLYRIAAGDVDYTLTMQTLSLATVSNMRFAVKVYSSAESVFGLTIVAPSGQLLEDVAGELVASVELTQLVGLYREWLCDAEGNWMLVGNVDPGEVA